MKPNDIMPMSKNGILNQKLNKQIAQFNILKLREKLSSKNH